MNIFILDKNPARAADYHCDKHVVKMILESSQMMSTAHELCGGKPWYRPTHKNHPCSLWVRKSKSNYDWLRQLFIELNRVYTDVYGKVHKCLGIDGFQNIPDGIPDGSLTSFALAMPDDYKTSDAVASYRSYYTQEKRSILEYKSRAFPEWIDQYCGTCRSV